MRRRPILLPLTSHPSLRSALSALWVSCALLAPLAAAAQTLSLHYQERPPYSSRQGDGRVTGLVASPAAVALVKAGIPFGWQLTPSQRQLALIQSGSGLHCGVGWFRNDERAAKGRYSQPLYRDRPLAALVREATGLTEPMRATELLAHRSWRVLVKDGYSYGTVLDRLLATQAEAVVRTSVDPPQMGLMLRSGRADWMIVAPEEAEVLGGPGLRLLTLSDVPEGPTRHLYCSHDVPADWIERIDRALATPRR